jgi:erythromycin esterase
MSLRHEYRVLPFAERVPARPWLRYGAPMRPALLVLLTLAANASAAETGGSIEGIVSDGGKPVARALVAAVPPHANEPALIVRSDAQGHFRLAPLPPAKYGVTATADGHTAGFTLDVAVAADTTAHADVKLGGEAITVAGNILDDATGQPVADASLFAARYSDVDGDLFAVEVVAGKFQALLPRARYGLRARAPGRAEERLAIADASTPDLSLRLSRAWPPGPAPAPVVEWLRKQAVPLDGVQAGHGFADLAPLASAIGDARIVGLGEATHGTREFFQLKHRLLEWLVAERGFDIFAIEATMPEAYDLNEYVLTGRGDPQQALAGLYFWTWDTEEVLDLIRWMRHWNEDPKHHKVKFYGFDMQYSPRAAKVAFEYVARVAPKEVAALTARLEPLRHELDATGVSRLTRDEQQALVKAAQALVDRFDAARSEWTARSSADAWAVARQHARILVQFLGEFLAESSASNELRDAAMAENIGWILEHEGAGAKIAVWAHNGHVSRGDGKWSWRTMGKLLAERWGKAYVNLGFAFARGSFRARDQEQEGRLRPITLEMLPAGSLDATLHATGLPRFVINLRAAPEGIVRDWLGARHGKRDFGAVYSKTWPMSTTGTPTVIAREYDMLAFVDETAAARGLPEGDGGDPTVLPEAQNLDLEDHDGDKPRFWTVSPQLRAYGWALQSSTDKPFHGARCALIRRLPGRHYGEADGRFQERLDATPFRGKRVRLTAAVRAKVHGAGNSARLVLGAELGIGARAANNNMREHPIVDAAWRSYTIELDVPREAGKLIVGGAVVGDGSACFDDFHLEATSPAAAAPP